MEQRYIDIYDEYTHRPPLRRIFPERLGRLAGSNGAAAALLPLLEGNMAYAVTVAESDNRIETTRVRFAGAGGDLARRMAAGRPPAALVMHESHGLDPHIEDVARRFAIEGFVAMAPDALTAYGATPRDEDRARDMIRSLDPATTLADLAAGTSFLDGDPGGNGRVGRVGFCWGGAILNRFATVAAGLDGAVAYCGRALDDADVAKVQVPSPLATRRSIGASTRACPRRRLSA